MEETLFSDIPVTSSVAADVIDVAEVSTEEFPVFSLGSGQDIIVEENNNNSELEMFNLQDSGFI